jgi:hypothetical protein
MILAVEAGVFPLMCGWWIDICSFVSILYVNFAGYTMQNYPSVVCMYQCPLEVPLHVTVLLLWYTCRDRTLCYYISSYIVLLVVVAVCLDDPDSLPFFVFACRVFSTPLFL